MPYYDVVFETIYASLLMMLRVALYPLFDKYLVSFMWDLMIYVCYIDFIDSTWMALSA